MTRLEQRDGITPHGDWVTVELELTNPMLEWIDAQTKTDDSIQDWIHRQIQVRLDETVSRHVDADVDIELPDELLYPLTLKYQDAQLRGYNTNPDELLFNHIDFNVTWKTEDGDPVEWTTED